MYDLGKIKMMIFGEGMNALACVGTNYAFNKSRLGDDEVKRKCPDLAEEKLQKTRDKWNEHRMKKNHFINKTAPKA